MTKPIYNEEEIGKLKKTSRALAVKYGHLNPEELQKIIVDFTIAENLKNIPTLTKVKTP